MQERWLDWLLARPAPGGDPSLQRRRYRARGANRPLLVAAGYLPAELDDEVALATLDKQRTYELAREAEVATPRTRVTRTPEVAEEAADELGYPCALKPVHSHLFARHFGLTRKLLLADSRDEVGRIVRETQALGLEMLLTEIIPVRTQLLAVVPDVSHSGRIVPLRLHEAEAPAVPDAFRSRDVSRDRPESGDRRRRPPFLHRARSPGHRDRRVQARFPGRLAQLIECNQRFTLAIELLRHAGIDLAGLAYQRAVEEDPARSRVSHGRAPRFPKEDMRAFLAYRGRGEPTAGRWLSSLLHRQHFSLFSLADPLPSIVSGRRFLRRVFARLPGARGRSSRAATAGERVTTIQGICVETTSGPRDAVADCRLES